VLDPLWHFILGFSSGLDNNMPMLLSSVKATWATWLSLAARAYMRSHAGDLVLGLIHTYI